MNRTALLVLGCFFTVATLGCDRSGKESSPPSKLSKAMAPAQPMTADAVMRPKAADVAAHPAHAVCKKDLSGWMPKRSGIFTKLVMRRALRPLVLAIQKRICLCQKKVPAAKWPKSAKFRGTTDPSTGTASVVKLEVTGPKGRKFDDFIACMDKVKTRFKVLKVPSDHIQVDRTGKAISGKAIISFPVTFVFGK